MTTELMPAHKSATTTRACDCGCSGTAECCELECLVQPRFFCGQLLADQDLTAMVDWVKAKAALQRFRDGWGVVCGLDVHCGRGGTVTVTPGYAIDCCGRDVVLCKETSFNVAGCWQRDPDPCREISAPANAAPANATPANAAATPALGVTLWNDHGPATTNNDDDDFEWPAMQAVDIFVRYSESQSGASSTLSRGACGCGGGCEYTRVDEGGELYCRPAKGCEAPEDPLAKWDEEYATESHRIAAALIEAAKNGDIAAFKAHIRRYGLHTFCYAGEWLCEIEQKSKGSSTEVLHRIVPLLMQDWRNHRLIRPCTRCGTESGVRLARVFLARKLNGGKESFSTIYVNAAPPFRRLLARDEWPVAEGKVNLAPYIWQPAAMAVATLQRAGVTVKPTTTNFEGLSRVDQIIVPAGSDVEAHVVVDLCNTERIGFFGRSTDGGHPLNQTP